MHECECTYWVTFSVQLSNARTHSHTHTHTLLCPFPHDRQPVSLLGFHHDDVVAVDGFHRRVGVDGVVDGAVLQLKGGLLERADHAAAGHPAQVTLQPPSQVTGTLTSLA